jgi:hypothetical protein
MGNIIIQKGRYRVVPLPSTRPNGEPRGFYLEVKRKGQWKQDTFKSQRADALKLFGERAKVAIR